VLADTRPLLRLIADKGYDADRLRSRLKAAGTRPITPGHRNRKRAIHYDVQRYRERWHADGIEGAMDLSRHILKAVKADTSSFTGNGVVVAVLDTGIERAHPAFAGMTIVEKDFGG
jgi:subtilisin family serine protease